ncbi:hypothetical protein GIB67_026196 [Kingdonia uniflora]|uniref:Uncharacterized protein n=1 Tax=Kingdonia uniflora TaxID=39325 RepID=A0A7J7NA78_9MAGN|nr:hypothetical protein GIB67_026196 [Kingdonia uniflora]
MQSSSSCMYSNLNGFLAVNKVFHRPHRATPLADIPSGRGDLDDAANMTGVLLFLLPCTMVWIPQSPPGVSSLDFPNFLSIGSMSIVVLITLYSRNMLSIYHIDHHTIETITKEPWLDFAVSEIENVLTAKLLSRKRMPLQVPNENCEYYLGDRCWRQLTNEARIPLDPPLSMSSHISPVALLEMRQAGFLDSEQFVTGEERETYASYWAKQTLEVGHQLINSQMMGNIDLFRPTTLRAGITPMVVTSTSVHSLSQDFNLPDKPEGPDPGWYMELTGRRELLPIHRLRDPPPMSSSYGVERLQQLIDELVTAHRHIDSIDDQLYAHDLQLRRGRDVWVVPLPPGGGARMRQRGIGLQSRGGGTSRMWRGTGDDSQ